MAPAASAMAPLPTARDMAPARPVRDTDPPDIAIVRASTEWRAIRAHYGERTARRSGVRLIAHIDEGLTILERWGASASTGRAWCLHPLVQSDTDLIETLRRRRLAGCDPSAVALAMAYRETANAHLSTVDPTTPIALSPLAEVNAMLVADKVQNCKDFERHHAATHPRSAALAAYFARWLARLGVDEDTYRRLVEGL